MKKFDFARMMDLIKFHTMIVLRGLVRTIYGALVSGLIAVALYGFAVIQSEAGYVAVFDFVAACATLAVAMCNVYLIGSKKGKRGKYNAHS